MKKSRGWKDRRSGSEADRAHSAWRDTYGRDRARVIHSAGFRRLQAKTQVLGIGEGDFHRTRLTHSMEAAQIGRGIIRAVEENWIKKNRLVDKREEWSDWLPTLNLMEAIALAHDIGHPPFGHGGEIALNYAMRKHGGFEGNGQTLRLLSKLEAHTEGYGLDLTRRSLLGILKYPVTYERVVRKQSKTSKKDTASSQKLSKPPKCILGSESDVLNWILAPLTAKDRKRFGSLSVEPTKDKHGKSKYHSLDTAIMELADDIAYGVHDMEDAIALHLVSKDDLFQAFEDVDEEWAKSVRLDPIEGVVERLFSQSGSKRKGTIGALVNAFIVSVTPTEQRMFVHPLLRLQVELSKPAMTLLTAFKDLITARVIKTPQVQTLEYRGQQLVLRMFEALAHDPSRFMKETFRGMLESAGDEKGRMRIVCDYVSGMTDEYATRMYERLFVPRQGHVFDRL